MSDYTTNYNLILPKKEENYDVETANTNNKIIDTQLGNKVEKVPGKNLSSNDFTNNYKNKLDALKNYDDTEIKDNIKNIQDEQTVQDKNIEKNTIKNTQQDELIQKLQANMIQESTEEATSLHVEDASNLPAVLSVRGNHYQETQEGTDNLAVLNEGSITQDGITVSVENGVASFSGANTSDAVTYITVGTAYLYAGQIYYMSAERQQTSGNSGLSIKLGSLVKWFTVGQEVVFECTETGEYEVRVSFGVSTVANLGTLKYLISKTSGAEWVQGKKAIPSVEYPSPIRTVGDNINYFSEDYYSCFSVNQQAIKEIIDDEIKVTTTANAYSGIYLNTVVEAITELTNKLKNKDVTYSFEIKADTDITINYGKNGNSKNVNVTNEYQRCYITYPASNDIGIYFYNSSATVTTFYIRKIKLEEGTEATADSPHGMGAVKIIKVNKNMFILPDSNLLGVEVAPKEDGTYKLNGTSTTSWAYRNGEYFWISPGKYTIFAEGLEELISAVFGIGTEDNSWKAEINTGIKEYTFTVTEKMKVRSYFTCSSSAVFNNNTVKVQLEKSDAKTGWIKHEQKEYILPVQKEMLTGDYFDLENSKEIHNWGYINTKNVTNLAVSLNTSNGDFRRYSVDLKINNRKSGEYLKMLCTHFKYTDSRWHEYEGICGWESGQTFCIGTFNKELDTAEKMKNYLLNNDVEIYYELAEQEELDLTEEQKETLAQLDNLDLFKGVNNIYTEQNLALLQLEYTADTKMYIDNKIANLKEQVNTTNELLSTTGTSAMLLDNLQNDLESEVM